MDKGVRCLKAIREFCVESCVPLTVGRGVRNPEQIQKLLLAGADKVSINTAAYEHPAKAARTPNASRSRVQNRTTSLTHLSRA